MRTKMFARRWFQISGACLLLASIVGAARGVEPAKDGAARQAAREFCVVGYLPDYRVDAIEPAAVEGLTDLVFFSLEPEANGDLKTRGLSAATLKKLQDLKSRTKVRLLATVGGWDRSRGFAPMATNPETRQAFIERLARFCQEQHFDGVDFDWEHPANRAEEEAYASLLAETRQVFQPQGRLVTVALAAWQRLDARGLQAVDRIHLMAYDHDDRKHSTFERAQADVEQLANRGADRAKICLGLPFYGRAMDDRSRAMTYAELQSRYEPAPAIDEAGGFFFNGPETVRKKTRYAHQQGLSGVMIWEIGQDAAGDRSLLRAIRAALSP